MTSSTLAGAKPILLAFSGGLDTSFCVPWLMDVYKRQVITVTVDTGGIDAAAARSLDEPSRAAVEAALAAAHGVVSRAAQALGMSRQALYRRMERYAIPPVS